LPSTIGSAQSGANTGLTGRSTDDFLLKPVARKTPASGPRLGTVDTARPLA
jgi:hypothetical protein